VQRIKRRYDAFIAGGGLLEDFETNRKEHKRRSDTLDDATAADPQQPADQNPGRPMRSIARELDCPLPSKPSKLNPPGPGPTSRRRPATTAPPRAPSPLPRSPPLVSKSSGRPLFF